jgi:DnaJ-class molecular chaperone
MNRSETIEAIAKLAENGYANYIGKYKVAESILNLPAKCEVCDGTGIVICGEPPCEYEYRCSTCHGTGLDPEKKLLAVIAEDQSLPKYDKNQPRESDYNYKYIAFDDVVKDAQQDMLSAGFRKVVIR